MLLSVKRGRFSASLYGFLLFKEIRECCCSIDVHCTIVRTYIALYIPLRHFATINLNSIPEYVFSFNCDFHCSRLYLSNLHSMLYISGLDKPPTLRWEFCSRPRSNSNPRPVGVAVVERFTTLLATTKRLLTY